MRLFISIDFPESILEEIHSWIPEQKGWKKSSIHQMHLTLVFLGNCTEREKDEIEKKLSQVEFEPFELIIEGLSAFPDESSPGIIWAGVRENEQLHNLQQKIFSNVAEYVKSKHTDRYTPHITIARKKSKKGSNYIVKGNPEKEPEKLNVHVESFHLKRSILKQTGSKHEILKTYVSSPNGRKRN